MAAAQPATKIYETPTSVAIAKELGARPEHSIWDMGHLFAAFFGFISARLLLKLSPVRTVSSPYELLLKCRSELSNK